MATERRIAWAGLSTSDFELYTTYENSRFCKPNPDYYRDVMQTLGVSPEECLMVGNDVAEDMIAETLGARVFLLTDDLINSKGADISIYPHGNYADLIAFIKNLNRDE
jgi:FMN phosphatase YigB (HAD superfamily)